MHEDQFARSVVREVGLLVRRVQAEMIVGALIKSDESPVTVGDFAAQAVVARRLALAFPHDHLVGEEDAASLRAPDGAEVLNLVTHFVRYAIPEATPADVCDWIDHGNGDAQGRFWTLDPIDGTKGFLRRDQYAVALALIDKGRVERGYLACPELSAAGHPQVGGAGALLYAARGEGAWVEPLTDAAKPQAAKVSQIADRGAIRLFRSVESSHTNTGQLGQFAAALGTQSEPIPMDSQAKYAALALGQGDMLVRFLSSSKLDYKEKIWDQAAGSIVVEEAGGKVTDLDGKPLDFSQGSTLAANRGVLASNGRLHDAALTAIASIGA